MGDLIRYADYSRGEVHDIFDPDSTFIPQAGTWGLHGIVKIPERPGDYVFFVTFGQRQAGYEFDEGITAEGVLRWQSQPRQSLSDSDIQELIAHDDSKNSIYLFLRTASRRFGDVAPYTYLGRLRYLVHDRDRQRPVYFTWQILDWDIPTHVVERIQLRFETPTSHSQPARPAPGLIQVAAPTQRNARTGVPTLDYAGRTQFDHAEQDARNRRLGLAGELAVIESEKRSLISAGRQDLADRLVHIAKVEGDGAGYDIRSFTAEGEEKFIEVKTTKAGASTPFYVSLHEVQFAADHTDKYYLYRIFDFDETNVSGKVFIQRGQLPESFLLTPIQFKAKLA